MRSFDRLSFVALTGLLSMAVMPTEAQDACTAFGTMDCMGCLNNTESIPCAWTNGGCFESCDQAASTGLACVSMGTGGSEDMGIADMCAEASDAQICQSAMDCTSCTNLFKGDGTSKCEWYIDDDTQQKWCHTGGCDNNLNNLCGAPTCDADTGKDSYTVGFPIAPVVNAVPDGPTANATSTTPSASGAESQTKSVSVMMLVLAMASMQVM